jgi:single-stranded DNA-binding protein
MGDIATATLSGDLTREVELRELPSGTDVARLRVASTARRRSGEEWVERTSYFTVEVYGAPARACAEYLGSQWARASSLTPSWTGTSGPRTRLWPQDQQRPSQRPVP